MVRNVVTAMLPPKGLYVVSAGRSRHLGFHGGIQDCAVFGFVKRSDAVAVAGRVGKRPFHVRRLDDERYMLMTSLSQRPVMRRKASVSTSAPEELALEMAVNNVRLEVIDEVVEVEQGKLVLFSHYALPVPPEIHEAVVRDRLNALYDGRPFTFDDVVDILEDIE